MEQRVRLCRGPGALACLLAGELWRPVVARPWARKDEDIFVYEARALVRAVEVLCAELKLTGCRVLCLVDNMSVALCFSRRRSKEYVVISLIRRLVAIGLTRNIKIHVRWIPSELNSSDAPSRIADIDSSHSGPSLFEKLSDILGRDGTKAQPDSAGAREADELAESTSCDEDPRSPGPRRASGEDAVSVTSPQTVSSFESARDGEETF